MFAVEDIFRDRSDNRRRKSLIVCVPGTTHDSCWARAAS
jgi:hypothetical protein